MSLALSLPLSLSPCSPLPPVERNIAVRKLTAALGIAETHVLSRRTGGNPIRSQQAYSGSICKANRPFTSIVVMVLTGWITAKEHYGSNMLMLLTTYP